jgi:hypothetical protein
MQEFMLIIRNDIDHQSDWSPEKYEQFLRESEAYVMKLQQGGRLLAAQPLVKIGMIISRSNNEWNVRPMRPKGEVQVGYYHILANNMDEAIEMAKGSPEFGYGTHARIEVRPIQIADAEVGSAYQE